MYKRQQLRAMAVKVGLLMLWRRSNVEIIELLEPEAFAVIEDCIMLSVLKTTLFGFCSLCRSSYVFAIMECFCI